MRPGDLLKMAKQRNPYALTIRLGLAQRGFTFVMVLAAMLIVALAAQGVMTVLSAQAHRSRSAEQQRIEAIYAAAIQSYFNASPGVRKQNPELLEDLLLDKRQVTIKRHLRRLYADPLQPLVPVSLAWEVVRDSHGRIAAVQSRIKNQSTLRPMLGKTP
jgi:type II secretory pathway pseudopilin PulG